MPDGLNVIFIVLTSPKFEPCSKFVIKPLKIIFLLPLALSGKSSNKAVPASPVVKAPSTKAAVSPDAALSYTSSAEPSPSISPPIKDLKVSP